MNTITKMQKCHYMCIHTHSLCLVAASALHAKQCYVTPQGTANVLLLGMSGDRLGAELQVHEIQARGSVRRM